MRCCPSSSIDVGIPTVCRLGSRDCSNREPHEVATTQSSCAFLHTSCLSNMCGALSRSQCPVRRGNGEVRTRIERDDRPRANIAPTRVELSTLRPTLTYFLRTRSSAPENVDCAQTGEPLFLNHRITFEMAINITFLHALIILWDGTWKRAAGT